MQYTKINVSIDNVVSNIAQYLAQYQQYIDDLKKKAIKQYGTKENILAQKVTVHVLDYYNIWLLDYYSISKSSCCDYRIQFSFFAILLGNTAQRTLVDKVFVSPLSSVCKEIAI